jgi:hypothetical protein
MRLLVGSGTPCVGFTSLFVWSGVVDTPLLLWSSFVLVLGPAGPSTNTLRGPWGYYVPVYGFCIMRSSRACILGVGCKSNFNLPL